jgi:thiol-disulfide isomerase/thioredoxin
MKPPAAREGEPGSTAHGGGAAQSNPRRGWLVAAVAALAAGAGVGWSWWRLQPKAADAAATETLWSQRFARPQGGELVMAELRGKAVLLNFWATWCPPCVKEMPELDRFALAYGAQVQVVGLAVDTLAPVQQFLARQPVSFAIGLAGTAGTDLARGLGNSAGVLPFTVLLDAEGAVLQRRIGETRFVELESWLKQL